MKLIAKSEFCCEGKENYIQKLISFEFQQKSYLAIARKSGLVQLYENVHENAPGKDSKKSRKSYKLYKDWKHSNMNTNDQIIAIGFIDGRYLYSCSNEGKLVFRDLINDDANESYMVFLIQKPVNCFTIRCMVNEFGESTGSYLVACAGKNNELKSYSILFERTDTTHQGTNVSTNYYGSTNNLDLVEGAEESETNDADDDDDEENEVDEDFANLDYREELVDSDGDEVVLVSFHPVLPIIQFSTSRYRDSNRREADSGRLEARMNSMRPILFPTFSNLSHLYRHYADLVRTNRRSATLDSFSSRTTSIFNERKVKTLIPNWSSRTTYKNHMYTSSLPDKAFNWFVSITFVPGKPEFVLCGNQFGELFVYDTSRSRFPVKKIRLSQFSITRVQIFENNNCQYIAYSDSMSRIGILNFHTFQQVNCFDGIKMGPISSCLFIFPPPNNYNMNYKRKLHKASSYSNFDPIIFITSTIEKKLLIYKLYNDNSKQLIGEMVTDSLIPSICFNGRDINDAKVYEMLAANKQHNLKSNILNLAYNPSNLENGKSNYLGKYDAHELDSGNQDEAENDEKDDLEKDFKKRHSGSTNAFDLNNLVEVNAYSVKKPSPLRYGYTNDNK